MCIRYVYLPKGFQNRQDLLQPWEMIITLIWKTPTTPPSTPGFSDTIAGSSTNVGGAGAGVPPPPGTHVFGPTRDTEYWEPVGITVDEDTLPHILTFTSCDYEDACTRAGATLDREEQRHRQLPMILHHA